MAILELNNVQLICVDGRTDSDKLKLSIRALSKSCESINFGCVKFLAPSNPGTRYDYHSIQPIDNLANYSRFMIKDLYKYIEKDYCLIIQWDGFVIKPELWEDIFLCYDYIGAPWPRYWPQSIINRVGNGGFSLRSLKLIKFIASLNFENSQSKLEDAFICLENKHLIEKNGFTFAPADIAARFSWENPIDEGDENCSFGFHGRHSNVEKYLNSW